ncbi:phytanoyl-CoA dioxygenase family protein [Nostoc sp. WHI]|uniref:phytanoyl-CoA dioxygenase family protein n=1 Tax=Nostoc sp. WHI TaxID=2650611 RepID=UPI0018C56A42|nr:phytanoyl-CoA dioxygenase family protein [Nostoc sp. WHI]MBG1271371.1 phytanoyl-CoA dioxygenase [Nostoc sp. WHI]
MQFTKEQVNSYNENGFLFLENYFSKTEIDYIITQIPSLLSEDTPRRILENNGAVRSILAPNTTNKVFQRLLQLSKLVKPSMQLLGSEVYVYQYKINVKAALEGDKWDWHQDFLYWHKEDGMPRSQALSVAIFLQEANDFNGPLLFIPGSHKEGMVDLNVRKKYLNNPLWTATFSADLKYEVDKSFFERLLNKYEIFAAKGAAGSVLFFDSNVFHGSTNNMSAKDRTNILITYNSLENAPPTAKNPRLEFIASLNCNSVISMPDNFLFEDVV